MAYSVDNIVPMTLSIRGISVLGGGGEIPVPPEPRGDWYNINNGLVDCSYGQLECNSEQILCL